METNQPMAEDDPHAWPSIYEPAPVPTAPVDMKMPARDPSRSMIDKAEHEQKNAGSAIVIAEGGAVPSALGPGPSNRAAKRAYGRRAMAVSTAPAKAVPRAADLDMFPAFMSRSALFGAFRPNCGGTHAGPLKAAGDVSLIFAGPRLSMADKRVWEAIVRIAKRDGADMSQPFKARLAEVADMAGYRRGQSRSAWAAIERLAGSRIDAVVYGANVSGWLLISAVMAGRDVLVRLDPGLVVPAFAQTILVSMAGAARCGGVASALALWLRDYFSTHKPPAKPLTLDYLRDLSGYPSPPKRFVAALGAAMSELAAEHPELIASWSIDKSEAAGNASARWSLLAVRGSAMPVVKQPPKPASATAKDPAPAPKKRAGPSL